MKKVTSFFALLFFAGSIFSHGGGLDKHGCHRETKTGGYHCHRSPSIDTNTPLPKEKYNQKKPNLKPTKSFKNVEDPDLLLLSLLIGKDMSTIENENKLFMKIEDSLTKLVCKGPSSSEYVFSDGNTNRETLPELIEYFAFNDKYFFIKYSSKWIVLDDVKKDISSFSWGYSRINKPLGNTDISFLSKGDIDFVVFLESAIQKIFINRETGGFYNILKVSVSIPDDRLSDFSWEDRVEGTCEVPGDKKF